ncbi:zinc-binding protein [Zea mays]|uniref:Zinc-binding protein n=1 Tax=Zea mays TaxID=4577 RepID=A0A1D6K655_MAIZE|nr:zinc-binding protein [Zea mays]ONL99054.1 zinc-binding protein [Zea mays]
MGGGNGQKSKMARERNLEKNKGAKGARLFSLFLQRPPFRFLDAMCSLRAIALGGRSDLMDLRVSAVQGASSRPTRRP